MKTETKKLSSKRLCRLRAQGYINQSDEELSELAFGHRFAFKFCTLFMTIGVMFSSIPLLIVAITITFLSIVLPNHVFDYVYNHAISDSLNKPKVPPRSKQLKFACTMATCWLAGLIYLFSNAYMITGYVLGTLLIGVAFSVAFFDWCIPSIIYNAIFKTKV